MRRKIKQAISNLKSGASFSRMQLILFAVVFAGIGGYVLISSFAASTTQITVNTGSVTDTLPSNFWGVGESSYFAQDNVNSTFQNLMIGMQPEIFRVNPWKDDIGTPSNPAVSSPSCPNGQRIECWRSMFTAFRAQTLPGGQKTQLYWEPHSAPADPLPTNRSPCDASNINSSDFSPATHLAWINDWISRYGKSAILGVGAVNEPDNNLGNSSPSWYSPNTLGSQPAYDMSNDWWTVHNIDYYNALKPAGVPYVSNNYSEAGAYDYNFSDQTRFIQGTAKTCTSTRGSNVGKFDIFGAHIYGGPTNDDQSRLNAIFYTPYSQGQSSFVAGFNKYRDLLNQNGMTSTPMANTEIGNYLDRGTGSQSFLAGGSDSALADLSDTIAAINNRKAWNLQFIIFWSPNQDDHTCGGGNIDSMIYACNGSFYGGVRYQDYKYLLGRYVNTYKRQVSESVSGSPVTPSGGANNPVQAVQTVAGLNSDGTKLGVVVENLDLTNSQPVTINLGVTASGNITGYKMPHSQPNDGTPLPTIAGFGSGLNSVTFGSNGAPVLGPGDAMLLEIPISGSGTNNPAPAVTLSASPTSISAGGSSTLTWSSTNATSCSPSGGWSSSTGTSGSSSVSPSTTTAYSITCTGAGGSTTASATITVTQPPLSLNAASVAHITDGNLNESDWRVTTPITKNVNGSTTDTASWGALWDAKYLYVGAKVTDSSLSTNAANDPGSYWQNDSVEVYVDPNADGGTTYDTNDKQLAQGWNDSGIFGISASTPGVLHAWAPITGGYSIEMAIPWSSLGVTPSSGMKTALDIGVNDSVNGSRTGQLMWNGTANNWQSPSAFGTLALAGTPITPDTIAPSVSITSPTNGSTVSGTVNVSATASDNVGVTKVEFYIDGGLVSTATSSPYSYSWDTTSLHTFQNGSHSIIAKAYDAAGNSNSSNVSVNVSNGDTTAPSTPSGLTATASSYNQVGLSWTASTDNVGVSGYYIVRNGTTIAFTSGTGTTYTDSTVNAQTSYSYQVIAFDAAGNNSQLSNTTTVTTPSAPDTTAPSTPTNLSAVAISSSQINLSWTASTDNIGVSSYDVYRNGTKIATVNTTSYGDTGLSASTSYGYYVIARDAAGNTSQQSNTAAATTQTSPPPAITGTLSGKISSSSGNIAGHAQIAIPFNGSTHIYTSYSDDTYIITGLAPATYQATYSAKFNASKTSAATISGNSTTTVNVTLQSTK